MAKFEFYTGTHSNINVITKSLGIKIQVTSLYHMTPNGIKEQVITYEQFLYYDPRSWISKGVNIFYDYEFYKSLTDFEKSAFDYVWIQVFRTFVTDVRHLVIMAIYIMDILLQTHYISTTNKCSIKLNDYVSVMTDTSVMPDPNSNYSFKLPPARYLKKWLPRPMVHL